MEKDSYFQLSVPPHSETTWRGMWNTQDPFQGPRGIKYSLPLRPFCFGVMLPKLIVDPAFDHSNSVFVFPTQNVREGS